MQRDVEATHEATLPLDGGNIHVCQDGPRDAPALVLIHGSASSTRSWDLLVPLLAKAHRVIRIDLLGHGRSAKPVGGDYRIPEQGRRVGEALDRLGVRHAIVVGHSSGGYTATALAEQRGDLVTALAFVDTGPRMDAVIPSGRAGGLVLNPVVGPVLWRLRTEKLIRKFASMGFAPGFEIPQQFVDQARDNVHHAFTASMRAAEEYLRHRAIPDRLTPLGKPLLVLFGAEDQKWRPSAAAEYHIVPGAKVDMLPGVGHSPIIEDPSRTAEFLLAFTGSVLSRQEKDG